MPHDAEPDLWSHAPTDWIDIQEGFSLPLWRAMLRSTEVGPGARLLDAGCGGGGACLVAEELGAEVTGLDSATGMIERANRRVPGTTFVLGNLADLPFEDARFDATIAASSVQYVTIPELAAAELARVTAPGGKVAIGLFASPDKVEYRVILDALGRLSPARATAFALSSPGRVEDLVASAGLEIFESGEVSSRFVFPDMASLWAGVAAAGPGQAAVVHSGVSAVRRAVETAAAPYRRSDGRFEFDVVFQYTTGLRH